MQQAAGSLRAVPDMNTNMKGMNMSKARTAAEEGFNAAENNFTVGADALKAGFDKAIAGYDSVVGYGKDTAEALIKSATVAGKGAESQQRDLLVRQAVAGIHRCRQGGSCGEVGKRSDRNPDRLCQDRV